MKHMNLVHAQTRAMSGFSVAQEGIAQEGLVDGVKDFFTFKAAPENANAITNTANALRGLGNGADALRQFTPQTPVDAMRFLFRHEKLTLNLPRDIQKDVQTLHHVNQALTGIVGLLKSAKLTDESDEINQKLSGIIKESIKYLDDETFLGNFYLSFGERGTDEYDGSHKDGDLKPSIGPTHGFISLAVNLVYYVFDRKAAASLMDKMNEVLKDTDRKALNTQAAAFAKELETSAGLVRQFLEEYSRLKKHDNKHVRHTLRYGHNIIYLVTIMARTYRSFAHYVV